MKTNTNLYIFVVEDNEWYGELLVHQLAQNPDHRVRRFASAQACLAHLDEGPDLITLDYNLPDASCEELLQQLHERQPGIVVVVISGQADIGTAVKLLRLGAFDYLVKDAHTFDSLQQSVARVAEQVQLRRENKHLHPPIPPPATGQALLGQHPSMESLRALIAKAAATSITVSISGETGTGKELVARAIHEQSARAGQPFVALNMAAIPRELLESELFGHEKGAFTGAVARRVGRFEEAHGGTLFLDEISDLDLGLQAKLLRVLQERHLTPVGSSRTVVFDVHIVVATHRDLLAEVQAGRFREDLYYRLLGLPLAVPPLRSRGHDVLLLADAFVRDFCAQHHLPPCSFTAPAHQALLAHPFPGNVRELKAVVELAAVLADGPSIGPENLSFNLGTHPQPGAASRLRDQTMVIIQRCLTELNGDVGATAARLGMGRSTLYRLLQGGELRLG